MVDTYTLTKRIARAIDFPEERILPIAKSILEVDLNLVNESLELFVQGQLEETGVGEQWNRVLDQQRAMYLAQKIYDLLPKPNPVVLDILSGTGTVAEALRSLGCHVIEADRMAHYPGLEETKGVIDLDLEQDKIAEITPDVVLVLTSLHHETDLNKRIGWLASLNTKRFIIVENLRTPETEYDLHQRLDWFFNRCLNDFGAECPGWYWKRGQWEVLLGSLGHVKWLGTMDDVPGIPFAYDLFDITR